ncbi:radical SAM family heme chaperone HemW [Aureibaculum sp. 2210JD6-5]|uniref:radical SAM family heme chaperone HemW n=1 Tax=Aureibaculum sp. 2210JD6-5 TaxID=3103957 RepID=UPI002AAEB9C8|nr:radical SAM family heme chaperone HemW [Aureibaculum sp. 2210JD6-5]MDY7395874.1 radical SAM family heme chaperone HemW [Aureibaculum sp. 2210JD6-5]
MSGIYLHIPFCKQACHYCDFHFSTSLKRKEEMIQALAKELILLKNELKEPIETIYFGGGTPSLLTRRELQFLINTIYKNYNVIENPEITLEANPDDLTSEKIQELTISPINRLSIGIQSFFDEDLQVMNRSHNSEQAKKCLDEATRYFDNITVDLIYGIPNMSKEHWSENLQTVFDFGINHISSYALTVEPKTALSNFIQQGKYPDVSEELALEHFNILVEQTEKQGFVHYEISNFGKPNYFSKHNTAYWLGKSYLGIGPSAHSFNGVERSWNVSNNVKYIKSIQENKVPKETEVLSDKDRFNENVMTGLRTIWGVSLIKIEKDFGIEFKDVLLKNAEKFIRKGTLEITNDKKLITTKKGKFLVDGIASDLFII